MIENTQALIDRLATELRPVRRLAPPWLRIATWLICLILAAALLATRANLPAFTARMAAAPDMWLAVLGSILTAIAAAIACFLVGLPDRSPRWAWLPLPPLLLWIVANGWGCLRAPIPGLHRIGMLVAGDECLPFILEASLPLALLLLLLLRRAGSLRPERTALTGGLAVAAGAASLLWLIHPFDAGLSDLIVHAIAVAIVIAALRLGSARWLRR